MYITIAAIGCPGVRVNWLLYLGNAGGRVGGRSIGRPVCSTKQEIDPQLARGTHVQFLSAHSMVDHLLFKPG
jgi:hypothetical protein